MRGACARPSPQHGRRPCEKRRRREPSDRNTNKNKIQRKKGNGPRSVAGGRQAAARARRGQAAAAAADDDDRATSSSSSRSNPSPSTSEQQQQRPRARCNDFLKWRRTPPPPPPRKLTFPATSARSARVNNILSSVVDRLRSDSAAARVTSACVYCYCVIVFFFFFYHFSPFHVRLRHLRNDRGTLVRVRFGPRASSRTYSLRVTNDVARSIGPPFGATGTTPLSTTMMTAVRRRQ